MIKRSSSLIRFKYEANASKPLPNDLTERTPLVLLFLFIILKYVANRTIKLEPSSRMKEFYNLMSM